MGIHRYSVGISDHVYHQSRNVGQLNQKAQDKTTDYNKTVYTQELGEILSHL